MKEVAAFQGERGAFSQVAVRQLLGAKADVCPLPRFADVFAALKAGKVTAAVVPIENTLHGSVHENYDHLLHHTHEIVAETSVRIVHNLIAPPGVTLKQIKRVYSHPVALNQCLKWFASHKGVEPETFYDTAGSVKMLMEDRPEASAAIASEVAASIYGARILERSIEDDSQNYTRFFLLRRKGAKARPASTGGEWKTSLVFSTCNATGSLFRALAAFALRDLNITKIESRPIRGKWEYLFYLDFLGHAESPAAKNALAHLGEVADMCRVLGCYPRGDGAFISPKSTSAPQRRSKNTRTRA